MDDKMLALAAGYVAQAIDTPDTEIILLKRATADMDYDLMRAVELVVSLLPMRNTVTFNCSGSLIYHSDERNRWLREYEQHIAQFAVGDVVTLTGGSIHLTVDKVSESAITCIWIDSAGHLQSASFHPQSLARLSSGVVAQMKTILVDDGCTEVQVRNVEESE